MTNTQEYAEKTKAHIDQLAGEIEKLQSRTDKVMEELRAEYDRKLREVSDEYDRKLRNFGRANRRLEGKLKSSGSPGAGPLRR